VKVRETKPQSRRDAALIAAELRGLRGPAGVARRDARRAARRAVDLGPFRALVDAGACKGSELRDTLATLTKRGAKVPHLWAALVAPWALPLPRAVRGRAFPKLERSAGAAARVVERDAEKVWPSAEDAGLVGEPIEQLSRAAEDGPSAIEVGKDGRLLRVEVSTEQTRRWVAAVRRSRELLHALESAKAAGYLAAEPGGERIGQALRVLRATLDMAVGAEDVATRAGRQRDAFSEDGSSARALAALHVGVKIRARLLRWATLAVQHSKRI